MFGPAFSMRLAFVIVSLALALFGRPAAALASLCAEAEPIALDGTTETRPAGTTALYRVEVPAAGVLLVHAAAPPHGASAPRLRFLGEGCDGGAEPVLIEATPNGAIARLTAAGVGYLALSSVDPRRALPRLRLHTAFAAEPMLPETLITLPPDPPASCTAQELPSFSPEPLARTGFVELQRLPSRLEDVDPIDCDVVGGGLAVPGVLSLEADSLLQATLYAGTACTPDQRQAEGTLGAPGVVIASAARAGEYRLDLGLPNLDGYTLGVKYFALCNPPGGDDHADVPLCATPLALGTPLHGHLETNDDDVFTFVLESLTEVQIVVRAEAPLAVALHDAAGQQLALQESGADRTTVRIYRTLGAGRYDVRIAGVGAVSAYTVSLEP